MMSSAARRCLSGRASRSLSVLSSRATGGGPLRPFLDAHGVAILDGGFGTALGDEAQKDPMWGSQLLFSRAGHERVQSVHRDFLEAGADIISTSSYQVSFECFSAAGAFERLPGGGILQEKHQLRYTRDVLRTSVELAKMVRHQHMSGQGSQAHAVTSPRPLVAASVGPAGDNIVMWTGATDAQTNAHGVADADVSLYYSRKISDLAIAKPDLVLLETLPGIREARLALAAHQEAAPQLPAIVSFICRSESTTAAGDDFAECVAEVVERHPTLVAAVGVNCTSPGHVEGLLGRARARCPDTLLVAYPNSGEGWDAREGERCWHDSDEAHKLSGADALAMREWGADVIGGCCRVTAEQIREFRRSLLEDRGAEAPL